MHYFRIILGSKEVALALPNKGLSLGVFKSDNNRLKGTSFCCLSTFAFFCSVVQTFWMFWHFLHGTAVCIMTCSFSFIHSNIQRNCSTDLVSDIDVLLSLFATLPFSYVQGCIFLVLSSVILCPMGLNWMKIGHVGILPLN